MNKIFIFNRLLNKKQSLKEFQYFGKIEDTLLFYFNLKMKWNEMKDYLHFSYILSSLTK